MQYWTAVMKLQQQVWPMSQHSSHTPCTAAARCGTPRYPRKSSANTKHVEAVPYSAHEALGQTNYVEHVQTARAAQRDSMHM